MSSIDRTYGTKMVMMLANEKITAIMEADATAMVKAIQEGKIDVQELIDVLVEQYCSGLLYGEVARVCGEYVPEDKRDEAYNTANDNLHEWYLHRLIIDGGKGSVWP